MKMVKRLGAVALAAMLVTSQAAPASADDDPFNLVKNTGGVAIGALASFNLPHKNGTYDDLIPSGQFSGYRFTVAVYIGPGYCLRERYYIRGELGPVRIIQGPREWALYNGQSYEIRALPQGDPLCR
ncbi:hypothetical protein [Actinomadura fibrosa]|uniref:Uncharacterized protein n=1 Tax=Actinomadura fibrosa TaxID=111802 RepID=A0ABW2XW05_9ACTN|nr:hypothetical protein [Actinomadura fibrosa]